MTSDPQDHLLDNAIESTLVDRDVHPREVMQILRYAQIAVTMEI